MKLKLGKPQPAFKRHISRQLAREMALEAFGIQPTYTNHYYCPSCDVDWDMVWNCACTGVCFVCGGAYTPVDYDLDFEIPEEEE
jgi:hypothetical protein